MKAAPYISNSKFPAVPAAKKSHWKKAGDRWIQTIAENATVVLGFQPVQITPNIPASSRFIRELQL
jgi:hypothetical protein